jgi:hypothetical protein
LPTSAILFNNEFYRSIGGCTRNVNESLSNMLRRRSWKRRFGCQEIMEILRYLSATTFNDGCSALLFILKALVTGRDEGRGQWARGGGAGQASGECSEASCTRWTKNACSTWT